MNALIINYQKNNIIKWLAVVWMSWVFASKTNAVVWIGSVSLGMFLLHHRKMKWNAGLHVIESHPNPSQVAEGVTDTDRAGSAS